MGVIDFEELRLSSGVRGGDVEGLMDIIVENEIKDSDESKKDSGFDKARWTKPKYQLSLPHGDKHGHMTHRALLILHHTGELLRQQLSTSQLLQLNSTNKKCSHLHR